jgi:hypothetical protein
MRRVIVFVIAALAFGAAGPSVQTQSRAPLATNVSGMDDWSTEFTFIDAFKSSRPWISTGRWGAADPRPLDLDSRGWVRSLQPGQVARTLMFWALWQTPGRYPAGRYLVTFEGEGTLEYVGGARLVTAEANRHIIDVNPDRGPGIMLVIVTTNPNNYIRNIRVIMPNTAEPGEIFYPPFLESIRRYKAIRFMNWMLGQQNNHIAQQRWEDRPRPEDARYSTKGVPVEVMVALCNRLNVDAWFSMSHLADDNYVRQFALKVRESLNPDLKVYIEHSNEVWNFGYPQARYAQARGLELRLSVNPGEAQMRYHSRRSRQIFAIFEEVFPPERLVRVMGSFVALPWVSDILLGYENAAAHTDVLAIAPYFGVSMQAQEQLRTGNLDQIFQYLDTQSLPEILDMTRRQRIVADRYGVQLLGYEGGQSLNALGSLANDPTLNALYDAANRDPRMGALYTRFLQGWTDNGGGLLFHHTNCFSINRYGRFGSLEYLTQPRSQAPKYDALQRWIE